MSPVGLILEPAAWSVPRLKEQIAELRAELGRMEELLSRAPPDLPNPWAVDCARRLVATSLAVAGSALVGPGASREVLANVANQLYECRNALPYLLRASQLPAPAFPSPAKR